MIPHFVQQVARYEGDKIKRGGFFWRFKRCCMVACILMHDGFHAAHDVAHRFIEFPAIRGLTKRNSKRHSSHQWFLISCNKLHATRDIRSSAVDFSDVLSVVETHRTFGRFNIVRHGSVHLDARRILRCTRCCPRIYRIPAVRGLTQCNFERHSSHQRFLISCNKLHATREIKQSAVDFSDILNVVAW